MLSTSIEKSSRTLEYDVLQFSPVFIIVVDEETNIGVLNNIQDPAQAIWLYSLGFLVDSTIDGSVSIRETDWDHKRFSISCR